MLIGACHLFVCADLGVLVLHFQGFESHVSLFFSLFPFSFTRSLRYHHEQQQQRMRSNITHARA